MLEPGRFLVDAQLKTMSSLYPELANSSTERDRALIHDWASIGPVLCRPTVGSHRQPPWGQVCMGYAMFRDSTQQPFFLSSGTYILSHPLPWCSLGLLGEVQMSCSWLNTHCVGWEWIHSSPQGNAYTRNLDRVKYVFESLRLWWDWASSSGLVSPEQCLHASFPQVQSVKD